MSFFTNLMGMAKGKHSATASSKTSAPVRTAATNAMSATSNATSGSTSSANATAPAPADASRSSSGTAAAPPANSSTVAGGSQQPSGAVNGVSSGSGPSSVPNTAGAGIRAMMEKKAAEQKAKREADAQQPLQQQAQQRQAQQDQAQLQPLAQQICQLAQVPAQPQSSGPSAGNSNFFTAGSSTSSSSSGGTAFSASSNVSSQNVDHDADFDMADAEDEAEIDHDGDMVMEGAEPKLKSPKSLGNRVPSAYRQRTQALKSRVAVKLSCKKPMNSFDRVAIRRWEQDPNVARRRLWAKVKAGRMARVLASTNKHDQAMSCAWRSFISLSKLSPKKRLKRALHLLRGMLACARDAFQSRPDLRLQDHWSKEVVVQFLNSLPTTAYDLKEYAQRIINMIVRCEDIRHMNSVQDKVVAKLRNISPSQDLGVMLNEVMLALALANEPAMHLRFRQKDGEQDLFEWRQDTRTILDELIQWLKSRQGAVEKKCQELFKSVKFCVKNIWALVYTAPGTVPDWPL